MNWKLACGLFLSAVITASAHAESGIINCLGTCSPGLEENRTYEYQKKAASVLVYDENTRNQFALKAMNNLGVAFVRAKAVDFVDLLTSNDWKLVIMDFPSTFPEGDWSTPLIDYLDKGGGAIVSFWQLDSYPKLQEALGVRTTRGVSDLVPTYPWYTDTFWDFPRDLSAGYMGSGTAHWSDKGDRLELLDPTASVLGGFEPTDTPEAAGAVLTNAGGVLVIGYLIDLVQGDENGNGQPDGIDLVENAYQRVD